MTASGSLIRVAVVAPIRSMRIGLASMLAEEDGISITAEAAGLDELSVLPPNWDVLLLSGFPLARLDLERFFDQAGSPPALVLLTSEPLQAALPARFQTRSWGILSTDSSPEELALAIRAASAGFWLADPALIGPLLRPNAGDPVRLEDDLSEPLTAREIEVLQHLAQGLANKQIAASLHLSENTIKFHISSIYAKLGAGNRAEAVRLGARRGYITF